MRAPVRTALSVLGRTLWAGVVLALVAAVVVVGLRETGEEPRAVAPVLADAPPAASVLVCPGPLRLATEREGEEVAYDSAYDPAPEDATSDLAAVTAATADGVGAAPATLVPMAGGEPVGAVAAGVEAGVLVRPGADAGLVLRAAPAGETPPWAAAAVAWRAGTGDLRGLAAASCQRPAATSWLVGGSTELGSSARLVLQNPGATAATVSLRLWGARGPVEPAGAPDYLVAPGEETAILLEGLAAEQGQLVVEVIATGGLVTAYVQDSRMDGLTPAGADLVVGGSAPATEVVVPAVAVTEDDPAAAVLRLLAPGTDPEEGEAAADDDGAPAATTTVRVTVLGPGGPVSLPGTEEVRLEVGRVLDLPLDGLEPGVYAVHVSADDPVVAGAMVTRSGSAPAGEPQPVERAWSPALSGLFTGPLALPGDEEGSLVLAAAPAEGRGSAVHAQVVAVDAAGGVLGRSDVVVRPESVVVLDLAGLAAGDGQERAAAVVVRSDDPRLAWGAVLDTGETVAVLAPVAQPSARPQVPVTVR